MQAEKEVWVTQSRPLDGCYGGGGGGGGCEVIIRAHIRHQSFDHRTKAINQEIKSHPVKLPRVIEGNPSTPLHWSCAPPLQCWWTSTSSLSLMMLSDLIGERRRYRGDLIRDRTTSSREERKSAAEQAEAGGGFADFEEEVEVDDDEEEEDKVQTKSSSLAVN